VHINDYGLSLTIPCNYYKSSVRTPMSGHIPWDDLNLKSRPHVAARDVKESNLGSVSISGQRLNHQEAPAIRTEFLRNACVFKRELDGTCSRIQQSNGASLVYNQNTTIWVGHCYKLASLTIIERRFQFTAFRIPEFRRAGRAAGQDCSRIREETSAYKVEI
jgi:hypothetical protein